MQLKILTVTLNPSVDKCFTLDRFVPERKLRCSNPSIDPGGGGINVSRAIRKLGGVSRAYFVKGGFAGESLDKALSAEGVDRRGLQIRGETRENLAFFDNKAAHYRFVPDGPAVSSGDIARFFKAFEKEKIASALIVGSGSLSSGSPQDFYARLASAAARKGARCIIDASGAALRALIGKKAYLVKPNLRELGELAGMNVQSPRAQKKAGELLVRRKLAEAILVSLGARGAALMTAGGYERFATPPVKAQSPIGAGDSMVAGITLALARGWELREAVRYGVAAGAAAAMTPATELCRRGDTDRLYRLMRRRKN